MKLARRRFLQLAASAAALPAVPLAKIVEFAKVGELDPERLCIAVLADLHDAPRAGAAAGSPAPLP
jgi:hypothetical protein